MYSKSNDTFGLGNSFFNPVVQFNPQTEEIRRLRDENAKMKGQIQKLTNDNAEFKALKEKYDNDDIYKDLTAALQDEELKDFVIKVDGTEIKVHKFILIARSKTFAEMIKNNPDADDIELTDISAESFKKIIKFIYTNKGPEDDLNLKEIFGAASKLKIKKLKEIAAIKLIETVNSKNSHEMLQLAIKFNNEELKKKIFDEIKKIIPKAKDEFINEVDKMIQLIDTWMMVDDDE